MLVSTLAREKTHALGGVLLVWFVIVHDLLALGVVAAFQSAPRTVEALTYHQHLYRVTVSQYRRHHTTR